jgi:hypothetical protein
MGTTLDLLWMAKCGSEVAMQDPDRRYIPPMALARQKKLAAHMGERPDWGIAGALRKSGLKCEGVNIFLADGEAAGQ